MLAALIIATSFNCSSTLTVTVNLENTSLILALSAVSVTSASETESTTLTNKLNDYMTIAMINAHGN